VSSRALNLSQPNRYRIEIEKNDIKTSLIIKQDGDWYTMALEGCYIWYSDKRLSVFPTGPRLLTESYVTTIEVQCTSFGELYK